MTESVLKSSKTISPSKIQPQVIIRRLVWKIAIATLLLAGIWYGLGKLELSFSRGREIPPRNLPENN